MAVVFFSGGIDSTTLASDVSMHPYRYGCDYRNERLVLLTEGDASKERQLKVLVNFIRKNSKFAYGVEHAVFKLPEYMKSSPIEDCVFGSLGSHGSDVRSAHRQRTVSAVPYTAGMHLFFASVAINITNLERIPPYWVRERVFFGFQFDGDAWDRIKHIHCDTTPRFIAALNKVAAESGHVNYPEFCAPFLDSKIDKVGIIRLAQELGVPLNKTSSCIHGWKSNCGHCTQCVVTSQAFRVLQSENHGK